MVLRQAQRTIKDRCLLHPGQCVLIGVSGGADSVALLHILHELSRSMKLDLKVAHLNHGIRGKDALRDSLFVKQLAESLKLDVVQKKVNVRGLAREKGISLEMAGREARYSFFDEAAAQVGADVVATAHTADDQAETVLLKLARGAGAGGLGGIRYTVQIEELPVVRPLLDVTRREIVSYLRKRKIEWREDESNSDTAFLRNRIRREVLPVMESKLNPRLREALLRTSELLREEDAWLDSLARGILAECVPFDAEEQMLVPLLMEYPLGARRRVLRMWLSSNGIGNDGLDLGSVSRVEGLLQGRNGSMVTLCSGWCVRKRNDKLLLELGDEETPASYRVALQVPGETVLADAGLRITATVEPGILRKKPAGAGRLPAKASISYSRMGRRRVYVRSWLSGDRMKPTGLKGSKKIQDIFVDEKVPRDQRGRVPLFECAGEIIWVPGYRVSREWMVPDEMVSALQLHVERI